MLRSHRFVLSTILTLPLLFPAAAHAEPYDLAALRARLDAGTLAVDDESAFTELSAACEAARDALAHDPDPAAKVLLAAVDEHALAKPWRPADAGLRAGLAWIAGRRGGPEWARALLPWLEEPDLRAAYAAARALARLLDHAALEQLSEAITARMLPLLPPKPGAADTEEMDMEPPTPQPELGRLAPTCWLLQVREAGDGAIVLLHASAESASLYIQRLPDKGFQNWMGESMGTLRVQLLDRLQAAARVPSELAEFAHAAVIDAVLRLGGPAALFPLARTPDAKLRKLVRSALERTAADSELWIPLWVALLEEPSLEDALARAAHDVLVRLTGTARDYVDRRSAAAVWRKEWTGRASKTIGSFVDRAIDRGVAFLRTKQEAADGGWTEVGQGGEGMTALALFTFLHAGVAIDDPGVQSGYRRLVDVAAEDNTYQEGAIALACAAYVQLAKGRAAGAGVPADRVLQRLQAAIDRLRGLQRPAGCWAYASGDDWDHSNTQLAMLGLAQAVSVGIKVEPAMWDAARAFLTRSQNRDGGWGYNPGEVPQSYGSMTAAGTYGTLLALKAAHPREFDKGLAQKAWGGAVPRGMAWLRDNLDIERGHFPHRGGPNGTTVVVRPPDWKRGSPYYWLYSLERLCLLAEMPEVAGRDWYAEGATYILHHQTARGDWDNGSFDLADTCLAILFLRRVRIDTVPTLDPHPGK